MAARASASPAPTASPGLSVYLQPFFFPLPAWHVVDSGAVPKGDASVAWASSIPFDHRDLPVRTGFPRWTIDHLEAGGIVVSVETTPWSFTNQGPWPKGSRMTPDLSTAIVRGPEAEEPARPIGVYEIDGPYALTRVYFGSRSPTDRELALAQRQLRRLHLPPDCPEPSGRTPIHTAFSALSGAPGSIISTSGTMPYRGEVGGYRVGTELIDLWWGPADVMADPVSLPWLRPPPYANLPAGVRFLGDGGRDACSFDITWRVPDVPPGIYRVQVLQLTETRSSMAAWGSIDFRVTS